MEALMYRSRTLANVMRFKYFYLMLIPVVVWYILFCYYPIYGLVMAFQDFSMGAGYWRSPWVGLKHFYELFRDAYFLRAFRNTAIIALQRLAFGSTFEIVLALLLNEVRHISFRKTVQTIVYLPHFLSWVIVASVFVTMLNPERGLIAPVFALFGAKAPSLLTDASIFRPVLIVTDIWKSAGFATIIYVAAIAGIDPTLYEAAVIDGAGRWRQLWNVTLPGISLTVTIMIIIYIGQSMTWGFDQIYNLYNRLVYETGDIIDTYIVRSVMGDNKFSYAAAAGMFRSVICTSLLLVANFLSKRLTGKGIF